MKIDDQVLDLIKRVPGLTELEISQEIFGGDGYQQRVNGACRYLVSEGQIVRNGRGGRGDPFRYTFPR